MTKNHGKQIKNDAKYEALRKQGASKEKAARIANTPPVKKEEKLLVWKKERKKNF